MRYIVIYQNYLYSFHSIDRSAKYSIYLVGFVLLSELPIFLLYLLFKCIVPQIFLKVKIFCKFFVIFVVLMYIVFIYISQIIFHNNTPSFLLTQIIVQAQFYYFIYYYNYFIT